MIDPIPTFRTVATRLASSCCFMAAVWFMPNLQSQAQQVFMIRGAPSPPPAEVTASATKPEAEPAEGTDDLPADVEYLIKNNPKARVYASQLSVFGIRELSFAKRVAGLSDDEVRAITPAVREIVERIACKYAVLPGQLASGAYYPEANVYENFEIVLLQVVDQSQEAIASKLTEEQKSKYLLAISEKRDAAKQQTLGIMVQRFCMGLHLDDEQAEEIRAVLADQYNPEWQYHSMLRGSWRYRYFEFPPLDAEKILPILREEQSALMKGRVGRKSFSPGGSYDGTEETLKDIAWEL